MTKMMKREQGRDGGESLEATEDRFKRWRASRQRGARIPMALWAEAVALAEHYGVERIAQALRVDEQRITKRVQRAGGVSGPGAGDLRFVELLPGSAPPAIAGTLECVVELANVRGARMRVQLNGPGLGRLPELCRAFWEAP